MRIKYYYIGIAALALLSCSPSARDAAAKSQDKDYTVFVDPIIGSAGHGHVFVGASAPFGAVQLGPTNIHTGWDWCSGYHYSDSVLIGFSHTHLSGTGCADLCDITLMPYTGDLRTYRGNKEERILKLEGTTSSLFKHNKEKAAAGYYAVSMENGVDVELTATERVGMHHYTYKADGERRLLFDIEYGQENATFDSYIKKIDDYTIEGYRFSKGWSPLRKVFFYAKFNQPIQSLNTFKGDNAAGKDELRVETVLPEDDRLYRFGKIKVEGVKAVATFGEDVNDLLVKVALSSVSCDNAKENMEVELADWDFNATRQATVKKWNNELGRIDVEGSEQQKRTFYTAMYHTMIEPQLYGDVNGQYRGVDDKVHHADYQNYTVFSTWDTYRTLHPLFTIIQRDKVTDMMKSFISIYRQQGLLPVWPLQSGETMCMPGVSSIPVLADACLKGVEGLDLNECLECMLGSADVHSGRPTNALYRQLGYLPDEEGDVSSCMEYAVDDWGIALLAKRLGRMDVYETFIQQGRFFKNYWDSNLMKIRPRLRSGAWFEPYSPFDVKDPNGRGHFAEGNGWQYTFMVPQCPEELIRLHGSNEAFVQNLDSFFVASGDMGEDIGGDVTGLIGMYAHGNEPSHHIAYLYDYAGAQWKTAERVSQIQRQFYTDKPDGLCGNEDCGQMSAWHVQSALGFFQVNPSNGVYVFGTPLFPKAVLNLSNGNEFVVTARNVSDCNIYIQSVRLNGKAYTKSFITYDDIMRGGTLEFVMGGEPNRNFGASPDDCPVSAK